MKQPELSILIPTYNEADIIAGSLDEIAKALGNITPLTEISVVDDGSDDLPQRVERYRLKSPFLSVDVIRSKPPAGKGGSLAKGFQKATAPFVGFLDVDLSTPPKYILDALNVLKQDKADAFIGSRKAEGSLVTRDQFFVKDILGHGLSVVARSIIFYGMRNYQDTQCGFKFYKSEVAKALYKDLVATDGLNDIEILIKANLMGVRVIEQGVVWTDTRESKRSLRRILFGELKAIARIMWTYRVGAPQLRPLKTEKQK